MYYLLNHKKNDEIIIVEEENLDDYGDNWEIIDIRKDGVFYSEECRGNLPD